MIFSFLADYLSEDHHNMIKMHRILSILLEHKTTLHTRILSEKENWLVKPSLFGKGEGIIFGKNVNPQDWIKIIQNCMANSKDFVIQEYVNQEKFTILHEEKQQEFTVAGCLMCFDTKFLGPGILRSSNKDLVALRQGGFLLYPFEGHCSSSNTKEELSLINQKKKLSFSKNVDLSSVSFKSDAANGSMLGNFKQLQIPSDASFHVEKFSFEEMSAYETSLLKYGIDIDKSSLIKYTFFKKNSIILLDNARFLHGRTKINDRNNHLVRMRFQSKYDELMPVF